MAFLSMVSSSVARWFRAPTRRDGAAVFERVDSRLLGDDGFRRSDSLRLDGAPWMVVRDAMPQYPLAVERSSVRPV